MKEDLYCTLKVKASLKKVKLLYRFEAIKYVKSKMTGVCRSDIEMMYGNFGLLEMQGHEGLEKC